MLTSSDIQRLFFDHYDAMRQLAHTLLHDGAEAEDVVQDVFARLITDDVDFAESKARAYLMTATRNGCLNVIARKRLHERVARLYPLSIEEAVTGDHQELLDAIQEAANSQLEEPYRSVFRLRFDQDLKLHEIASQLGLNINTVYRYLTQSIHQVRRFVENDN